MLPCKIMTIQDDILRIVQKRSWKRDKIWQVELPPGTVVDGVCKDEQYLKRMFRAYERCYGGRFLPTYVYCHSSQILRWHRKLPNLKRWERQKVMSYHQQELMPLSEKAYTVGYKLAAKQDDQQMVYFIGMPKTLIESYQNLWATQKMWVISFRCEVERRVQEVYQQLGCDCILLEQIGDRLYGSLVVEGQCMLQNVVEEGQYRNANEQREAIMMQIDKMCYFYTSYYGGKQVKELVFYETNADTSMHSVLDTPVCRKQLGKLLGLRLRRVQGGLTIDAHRMRRFKVKKKGRVAHRLSYYTSLVALLVGGLVVVDGVRWIEHTIKLARYQEALQDPRYQQLQTGQETKKTLESQLQEMEHMYTQIKQPGIYAMTMLQEIDPHQMMAEQGIRSYHIQGKEKQMILQGESKSSYKLLQWVRQLQEEQKSQEIECQFEDAKRWGDVQFVVSMATREEKQSEME